MSTATATTSVAEPQRMQCMEVWGGNLETDQALEMPGLRVWLSSHAYDQAEAGGDVYYVSACASGRITRFLLADISGHGAAVSQTAVALRDLMRKNVNVVKQRKFVEGMNAQFAAVSAEGRFATALACTYFSPRRSFQLSNAGHPPPFLYRAASDTWSVLDQNDHRTSNRTQDVPLGIDAGASFSVAKIYLQAGDLVVAYSDGYTDAQHPDGRVLGVAGLFNIVGESYATESGAKDAPARLIPEIRRRILELREENLTGDDATMAVLQCVPGRTTLKDNLLAALRVLRPVRDATKFRQAPR